MIVIVGVDGVGHGRIRLQRGQLAVAEVGAVNHEDDGVAAAVVAGPEVAQRVLATHIPDFEVHVRQVDGRDVLADRRHRFVRGCGVVGEVEGFDAGEEGRFAGIVEAKEENGVFCDLEKESFC